MARNQMQAEISQSKRLNNSRKKKKHTQGYDEKAKAAEEEKISEMK